MFGWICRGSDQESWLMQRRSLPWHVGLLLLPCLLVPHVGGKVALCSGRWKGATELSWEGVTCRQVAVEVFAEPLYTCHTRLK